MSFLDFEKFKLQILALDYVFQHSVAEFKSARSVFSTHVHLMANQKCSNVQVEARLYIYTCSLQYVLKLLTLFLYGSVFNITELISFTFEIMCCHVSTAFFNSHVFGIDSDSNTTV